jgi:ASC-1-like (ASCH) protein
MTTHELKLLKKYFDGVVYGTKSVECRCYDEKREKMKEKDFILFVSEGDSKLTKIVKVVVADSFRDLLTEVGVERCLPGVGTVNDGVEIYNAIGSYREWKGQVVAFEIALI